MLSKIDPTGAPPDTPSGAAEDAVAQAQLAMARQQPFDPIQRAIEGFAVAASGTAAPAGAQARAIADAGANARTALQRPDLSPAQAVQVRQVLEPLGNAVMDGKIDPHVDNTLHDRLYDLATAEAGSSQFEGALAQMTRAAQRLDESHAPAGGAAQGSSAAASSALADAGGSARPWWQARYLVAPDGAPDAGATEASSGPPTDDGNDLDRESDNFAQAQQTAKDYIDTAGIKLSATQKTYIDQSLQVAVARGHIPSHDDVVDLVDRVSTTPFPRFSPNVFPASISLKSLASLNDVAANANIDVGKLVVTSSARTPAQQAAIMYGQLQDGSISSYGPPGQQVIAVYNRGIANGDDADTIRDAMRDKMADLLSQGIAVSNHFVNLDEMNVFDIGPGTSGMSAAQKQRFQAALVQARNDGTITNFLSPFTGHDPAFHIEIKQP